ncbi:hypothetical protein K7W03_25770 [Sphingobium sp. PNB]|uniref:hypothetical protein n=1 Tax=Sphingobium sp. PNB TaxID=863934 RepID=UPI001CA441F5|nr:hypothetical protein [Sphingobium sp. PNB]MCB4862994.1 hypothetical protein [Sphingobium sp. PNB]
MQPSLPELPPMKPVGETPDGAKTNIAAATSSPSASRSGFQGTKRLRQMMTILASGGLILAATIGVGELVLRPGIRPTDIMATIEARTESGIFNQKMGAAPGEMVMTEDQYREKLAEAERSGQAKAEIVFQRELAAVQADKEKVVGAYNTLYQRTNLIAQAGVQVEAQAIQFRQRLIEQTNGGRALVINIYDGLCALGDHGSCESARQARAGMVAESNELTEGQIAKKVAELMAGIPDPASFVAGADMRQNGAPTLRP